MQVFIGGIAVVAAALLWMMADWEPVLGDVHIPWWLVVLGFVVSEMLVFHMRLRQDAHSFSMSEIPLVVSLFFVSPFVAITAQAVANLIVLGLLRRQVSIKVAFNISQFALQTALAVMAFRALVSLGDPLGLVGWIGGLAGVITALIVADLLITVVIRLSGGSVSVSEMLTVFALSSVAAVINTALALIAVTLLVVRPSSAWLALAPPGALFIAYRGYVSKREEGESLEALYEATRALHAMPQIDLALGAAVERARSMIDAEYMEIVLFPSGEDIPPMRVSIGPDSHRSPLSETGSDPVRIIQRLLKDSPDGLFRGSVELPGTDPSVLVREAVVVPLVTSDVVVGALVGVNRLGDVSEFGPKDVKVLRTVASQVAVSLRNGRLEDSLAQLTDLKDQLEGLVRSKDQLVASVSHELRTPLTAVVGLARELRDHRDSFSESETGELIGLIAEQGGDLANIIEDLLVAARSETDTLNLRSACFDPEAELDSLGRLEKFTLDIGRGCDSAFGDVLRFRQIIRNLLSNADRYGGEQKWIEVRANSDEIVVAVIDDGNGVPPSDAEMIFEPYQRVDNGGTQPLSVGLGLAVSRKLARMMDGDLRYRRSDGMTRFELRLPREAPVSRSVA